MRDTKCLIHGTGGRSRPTTSTALHHAEKKLSEQGRRHNVSVREFDNSADTPWGTSTSWPSPNSAPGLLGETPELTVWPSLLLPALEALQGLSAGGLDSGEDLALLEAGPACPVSNE